MRGCAAGSGGGGEFGGRSGGAGTPATGGGGGRATSAAAGRATSAAVEAEGAIQARPATLAEAVARARRGRHVPPAVHTFAAAAAPDAGGATSASVASLRRSPLEAKYAARS